ncbi:MAG TPA: mercuric reductase [Deltaproteobacteria bacterium]|nr:mercuric reductase [Candidatus Binatota bacterium]HIL13180.1 mercuric reductase [Deltaproteobacteria bacterium]
MNQLAPDDSYNSELLEHVHPRDWTNPDPKRRYHLLVLGGGPAGLVAAAGAASLGARVALVEKGLLGGDCLNSGCVPSKALLEAARKAWDNPGGDPELYQFSAVMERMREIRATLAQADSARRFTDLGVDVFLGHGRFTGTDRLEVDGSTLLFRRAMVATGAVPTLPPVPGLSDVQPLTSENFFNLEEQPARLVVIGAGPIGCELSQAMSRLGSHVTLIDSADRILPNEDPDASRQLASALTNEGVELILNCHLSRVSLRKRATILNVEVANEGSEIEADQVLVATGRRPVVEDIGLESAGVEYTTGGITVNERLRTSNRRIYAAGDVCSVFQFTHAADAMARIVLRNALFGGRERVDRLTIPWCTYTSPELAHVGMTAHEAQSMGKKISTFTVPLEDLDRSVLAGSTRGLARVHVSARGGRILGATLLADHAGEAIGQVTQAINSAVPLGSLASVIQPYPTVAEAWKKLGDQWQKGRLNRASALLLKVLLRLRTLR